MKSTICIAVVAGSILFSGCSNKIVLKKSVIEQNQISEEVLSGAQLYNSHHIVLTRYEGGSEEKRAEKGAVNIDSGTEVDQIIIKDYTKGRIVKFLEDGKVAVSFEADESLYLIFGTAKDGDVYRLQALRWENGRGEVKYGEHTYYTNSGASSCMLLFKMKKNHTQKRHVRVAKGNKI